jgi:site-specific recombinase XerD
MATNCPAPKAPAVDLYTAYTDWLAARKVTNMASRRAARRFLARFPDPQAWAALPVQDRLGDRGANLQPFLNFLMMYGFLRPGYDYLVACNLKVVAREEANPLGPELARFKQGAQELGYSRNWCQAMTVHVAARLLVQTGRTLDQLKAEDFDELDKAVAEQERRHGRPYRRLHHTIYGAHAVVYHLGALLEPMPKRTPTRWSWGRHLEGVAPQVREPIVAYLERVEGTLARSTVQETAASLALFAHFLAKHDPGLESLALLDRRRHIEPYLNQVAAATNRRTGAPTVASTVRKRAQVVGRFLDDIAQWGWREAPPRRLVFPNDYPRVPNPLPRYLPPDDDRALVAALEASPNRLRADALLLLRETGLRIGELCDLELDCVHEVPGQGAWLKVPLGKLLTERMVPMDDETVALVDRIVANRSSGRALRHRRTGQLAEFLLTYQGHRVSACSLRDELHRAATEAGLEGAVPHQLRHTYATALVNAGCSLQALMALLGHVSAGMSLRYGRLFDATVRDNYERALAQAKARLGPVLPEATPLSLETNWKKAPLIKARLAGGYCLRTLAQGSCAYANICEHCPNFRSDKGFLPVLQLQRVDAEALLADAEERGWGQEATRHRRLIERIDALIAKAHAS